MLQNLFVVQLGNGCSCTEILSYVSPFIFVLRLMKFLILIYMWNIVTFFIRSLSRSSSNLALDNISATEFDLPEI
ncbi:hypothetical protein KP509_16G018500 [Ceratopteris richardii]|uniref:Uncharacterized protein n=1 Tax=Ceratopteris richardii TaxID=49495 RepID=A0A8T2T2M9_CERRI|nr:hypothetical protein KP509_16G018500 [Ceratopteris richardii]